MQKPVFDGKCSKSHVFWGVIFNIFGILGVLMLHLAFLTPKRHFLIRKDIYRCISLNSPISSVSCTLFEKPPKGEKKCHRECICWVSAGKWPHMRMLWNFGTVGLVGYVIALTAVGPHQLTGLGVSRYPSWVPAIDKAHRAYCTSCSCYRGNAW